MRNFAVLVLLGLVGCIGDDNATPADDAGSPVLGTLSDATTINTPPGNDAGPMDATVQDAFFPDAIVLSPDAALDAPGDTSPEPVTLTVVDASQGLPESGVSVVFSDATGAIVGTVTTGPTGTASMLVPAGGMVTAVFGTSAAPSLITIVGVEPGDVLTAIDTTVLASRYVNVSSLPSNLPNGASAILVAPGPGSSSQCGTEAPCSNVYVPSTDQIEGKVTLLFTAEGADDQTTGYYAGQIGIPLALDGGVTSVAATGSFTNAAATQTMVANNYPAASISWFSFSELAGGVPFSTSQNTDFSSPDGGDVSFPFTVHTAFAQAIQPEVSIATYDDDYLTATSIATRGAPSIDGGTTAMDLSTMLPTLTMATVDVTNDVRPIVAWGTDAGSLASADGAYVALTWDADQGAQRGTWSFVVPPTASQVQAPVLPASLAAWLPDPEGGASAWSTVPEVGVIDATFLTSYAQVRSTFASFPTSALYVIQGQAVIPPLPVDGTLRLTAYTANGD